jgi:dihydropteroate synthase
MAAKNTYFSKKTLLNCNGKLVDISTPKVMGILNVTPDSFYDGGRYLTNNNALQQVDKMIKEGATFIDIGGMSTKPGAAKVGVEEELKRVIPLVEEVARNFPEVVVSIDTVRGKVAKAAIEAGAGMVNDISAGSMDKAMFKILPLLNVPYILMHMQGTPQTMQDNPQYSNVTVELMDFFIPIINRLKLAGVKDIMIDPGFGFGKTVEHNYTLLNELDQLQVLGLPVVVGLSRKSMICKVLKKDPKDALNGTTALHSLAILKGVSILRVHDVREAVEVIQLCAM